MVPYHSVHTWTGELAFPDAVQRPVTLTVTPTRSISADMGTRSAVVHSASPLCHTGSPARKSPRRLSSSGVNGPNGSAAAYPWASSASYTRQKSTDTTWKAMKKAPGARRRRLHGA